MRAQAALRCAAAMLLVALATADRGILPAYSGFIRVQGGKFVDDDCNLFPVTGLNAWDMMECGAGFTFDADTNLTGPEAVRFTFQSAAQNGLTLVRTFGHGHDAYRSIVLQPRAGLYNETAFRGLDFVLDQASIYGVKVMFTLANNWKTFDSKYNYVKWADRNDLDDFWTDAKVKRLFKNHIDSITSRVNIYNGRRYRDDPTIFAWDLINEPRCNCFPKKLPPTSEWGALEGSCSPKCANKITEWTHEMAAYLKERDPNHLVTVGLEGFWGADTQEAHDFNPLNGPDGELVWTSLTGQNFTAQHDSPHIDFCGAHYWPDVWANDEEQEFLSKWIKSHADACHSLGKPFVLEEFGKNVTTKAKTPADWKAMRTPMFTRAYNEYISSLQAGGNYQGALFWKWGLSPRNPRDDFLQVAAPDPTFTEIVVPSAKAALEYAKAASPLQTCQKVTRPDAKIGVNAVDRTLEDWLLRCDEATAELALEMKRNHTHHVHSILGGKGVLTDKEIIAPEDELASQVNDTELLPALSTAFSEAEASGGHVGSFSTIFDDQKLGQEGGGGEQQQPSSEGDAQAPFEAKGGGKGSSSDDQGVSAQDKAALEGDAAAAAASPKGEENSNSNRAGGMRGMRAAAAGGHQHASGGGGELPGSQDATSVAVPTSHHHRHNKKEVDAPMDEESP